MPRRARRPPLAAAGCALALAWAAAGLTGCSKTPDTPDPGGGGAAAPASLPGGFPTHLLPGANPVLIDVVTEAEAGEGFGPSATWRLSGGFDDAVRTIETALANLRWRATRTDDRSPASQQTSFVVDNDALYAARVFAGAGLKGVRVTLELPAAGAAPTTTAAR
ncbi:MAG: hypothetical protein ACKVWR_13065 [Acidimicrobiales bacterium]